MNTPNNIELHSYETFFTSLAWIQGGIITWMYATGTSHKATLLGASTLTNNPRDTK